jgi:hypothetical protein
MISSKLARKLIITNKENEEMSLRPKKNMIVFDMEQANRSLS